MVDPSIRKLGRDLPGCASLVGGEILGTGQIILCPALSHSTKRKGATKLEEHQ